MLSSKLNDAGVVFLVPGSLEGISELSSLENCVFHAFRRKTFKKTLVTRCTVEIEGADHTVSDSKLTLLIGKNTQNNRGPSHGDIIGVVSISYFCVGVGGTCPPPPRQKTCGLLSALAGTLVRWI